jgi:hypothetical protein
LHLFCADFALFSELYPASEALEAPSRWQQRAAQSGTFDFQGLFGPQKVQKSSPTADGTGVQEHIRGT